ncbi:MAG: hypothetical protein HQL32_02810 [Planctomycetes bacterium]|nr:hypothetical protein [Planctomycetota bacterium]
MHSSSPSMLQRSLLKGPGKSLCSPGSASEFIQPWYEPLKTSPENTGIALGGIGSSYTMTPCGTTPIISFIPGLHVEGQNEGDIKMQNWFAAERSECDELALSIVNEGMMMTRAGYYPLKRPEGLDWIPQDLKSDKLQSVLEEMLACPSLYDDNRDKLECYHIELSPRTQRLIQAEAPLNRRNASLLLDYFSGAVRVVNDWQSSLTGDLDESDIHGQSTYPSADIHNEVLYPLAEMKHRAEAHAVEITRKHFSPIVKGDAQACSAPVNFTEMILRNPSEETKVVTLVWAQENLSGFSVIKKRPGVQDAGFVLHKITRDQHNSLCDLPTDNGMFRGIKLGTHAGKEAGDIQGELSIGVIDADDPDITITRRSTFYSEQTAEVVCEALGTGRVNNTFDHGIFTGREALSAGLVIQVVIKPGDEKRIPCLQVLDYPEIDLGDYRSNKKYLSYFAEPSRCESIIEYACNSFYRIQESINQDMSELLNIFSQSNVVSTEANEDTLLTLAQNTLSFIADASIWDDEGHFLVRECADYPFFNSLDVYFYGSFSLLWLLPEVDTDCMRHFSQAVLAENPEKRRYNQYAHDPYAKMSSDKYYGPRAIKGAVVHDLGSPFDPHPDAYDWHNVVEWKDLAPKYILMVLRNYRFTANKELLSECWESVEEAFSYIRKMIPHGHHLPLTNGTDDTFDNLSSYGISLYCGSLWVAGLRAIAEIARILDHDGIDDYENMEKAALNELNNALWDSGNQYYHFYSAPFIENHIVDEALVRERLGDMLESDGGSLIQSLNSYVYGNALPDNQLAQKALSVLDVLEDYDVDLKGSDFRRDKLIRKAVIIELAGDALDVQAKELLVRESDDSFGDPLLADTYLQMLGLPALYTQEQRLGVQKKVYETNFKANSPHVGYANLVASDGKPLEAFQAQDVWIGVQYSNAASLLFEDKEDYFQDAITTLFDNLYNKAKIPMAAPEGFNCSCVVLAEDLKDFCQSYDQAEEVIRCMQSLKWLLADRRVSPDFPKTMESFSDAMKSLISSDDMPAVYAYIQSQSLKYTAGRYFRPGMVFALPLIMKSRV